MGRFTVYSGTDRHHPRTGNSTPAGPNNCCFVQLIDPCVVMSQGPHDSMLLPSVNRYYRALQYQQLKTPQFGVQEPPGFFVEVRACCRPAFCWST